MPNLLGLSMDVNGIGWALLDSETNKIKAMGSRVFSVGCENFGSGKREISKKTFKRQKRMARLRYQRSHIRRIKVIELLVEHGLCPLPLDKLKQWKQTRVFPTDTLQTWLESNPYSLRQKAVSEALTLHEIGRILYQICIHRGFPLSERNRGLTENAMYVGLPNKNRLGINHTQKQIENSSLGVYLHQLLPKQHETYNYSIERVRNRFLSREMFEKEVNQIWNFQSQFLDALTQELRSKLIGDQETLPKTKGAIFFQRPLKSQKHRVGRCPYEPAKTKCCISSLIYQQLLAYRWATSIKCNGNVLSSEDLEIAAHYYLSNRRFSFQQLKVRLSNQEGHYNIKEDILVKGSFVYSKLTHPKLFGMEWYSFSSKKQEDIWHSLYFFNDVEKLIHHAQTHWHLEENQALQFARIQLDKNYAPISKKAARSILFFLRKGISYNLAVLLAGVKNAFGSQWDQIEDQDVNYIISSISSLYYQSKSTEFDFKLKSFLKEEMHLDKHCFKSLYGLTKEDSQTVLLPAFSFDKKTDREIQSIKNPLLVKTTFQLRALVNELLAQYGKIETVKAELSADLKLNKYQRFLQKIDTKRREKLYEKYIAQLREWVENITPMNLTKLELWEECKKTCPYTGVEIDLDQLFTEEIQVVYIQPWDQSLNDSHWNKTLCVKSFVPHIISKSPYEYFTNKSEAEWEVVVKRASHLFSNTKSFPSGYRKFKRFIRKYNQRDPFYHQLKDSNLFSRDVTHFLEKVIPNVEVAPGHITSLFVKKWRLEYLFEEGTTKSENLNYRFSALLAYINANRSAEYIKRLVEDHKYLIQTQHSPFPEPFEGFRDELEYHLNSILVSHKKENKLFSSHNRKSKKGDQIHENYCLSIRGSLHKESVYGKRISPEDQREAYHIRKPINQIETYKQLQKIVDPVVREILIEALQSRSDFDGDRIPQGVFCSFDQEGYLMPKVFVPNTKGDPVPIRNVRIREFLSGAQPLKPQWNQYVNLRNNHHVLIYLDETGEYNEQVVTFWEAARRVRFKEPIYQLPNEECRIVTTLEINDMFLLDIANPITDIEKESYSFLAKHLYRVQKLSSHFYEFRLAFDKNTKSTTFPEYIRINNFGHRKTGWHTHNPIKVRVSTSGQISLVDEEVVFLKAQKNYV